MQTFWLSYTDTARPAGDHHLHVIIAAETVGIAIETARGLGAIGELSISDLDDCDPLPPAGFMGRALTNSDIDAMETAMWAKTHYWLSFVAQSRPAGDEFVGACIVQAWDAAGAIKAAWKAGCNPGIEVAFQEFDGQVPRPPEGCINRLLTRAYCAPWKQSGLRSGCSVTLNPARRVWHLIHDQKRSMA